MWQHVIYQKLKINNHSLLELVKLFGVSLTSKFLLVMIKLFGVALRSYHMSCVI